MLRLFRINSPVNYLIIFVLMLALWAYKFIVMPPAIDTGGMHSYFFRLSYESSLYQYAFTILAFYLSFAFACYTAKANFTYQIVESGYQLPSLFYALLTGVAINAQRCIPEMVASLFVSFAIVRILGTYNKPEAIKNCLDVGLLFAISVIFAYKFILLLPAILIVIAIVKPISWRDLLSFFISFFFMLALVACFVWLYGDWNEMISSVNQEFVKMVMGEKYNITNMLFLLPLLFSVLGSLLSIFILKVSRKTSEMKFHVSMLFLLIYFVALIASPLLSNESVWLIYFPLCYLLSNIVIYSRRKSMPYIMFYGLMILIIFSQVVQKIYYDSIF